MTKVQLRILPTCGAFWAWGSLEPLQMHVNRNFACSKKLVKKHWACLIKVQITSFCFELDFELYTFNVFMPVLLSIKEPNKVVLKLEILTWKLIFPACSEELRILKVQKMKSIKSLWESEMCKAPRRPMWELLLCWKIIFCATRSHTTLAFSLLPAFLHSQTHNIDHVSFVQAEV